MNRHEMDRLAWTLAERGIAGLEHQLTAVATAARRAGVRPVAAEVLADPDAPEIARLRAFALVASALADQPSTAFATAA